MADAYKGLTIKLGADDTKLSAALKNAKKLANGTGAEMRNLQKALKLDPGNTKLLAEQQEVLQKQVAASTEKLELLKKAESEIGKENMSGEQWTYLQADIVLTQNRLDDLNDKLAVTRARLDPAVLSSLGGALAARSADFERIGARVSSAGSALTRTLTPAIIGAGGASLAAAVKIDAALTGVKKTVNGTDEQYQRLKESAIEFSKVNAVSADQVLDIQALGAQLGFAIDELDEFSRVVSGLDIATNMDAETAGTEMARFANITKMSHGEISNYASAVVGLGNNMATTESDISAMAMRLAAAGTQVGMSQADILGLAAALSSMGVEAEAGGTAISTIMSQIDKDVATNSASVKTWADAAGMSAQAFADAWRSDPVDALSALLSGMEGATAEGGNMSVMLEELGIDSVRQTDIMKRLAGNSDLVAKAVSLSNDEWSKNTALGAEVENRNSSLAAKIEMLKNRVIAMAEEFGGPLADALLDVVDQAEPLIKQIESGVRAFANMSDGEQRAVVQTLALAAALGPALKVIGGGIGSIGRFGESLKKMSETMSGVEKMSGSVKFGLASMGLAIVAAEIALVYRQWEDHNREMRQAEEIARGLANAEGAAAAAVSSAGDAAEDASSSLSSVRDDFADLRREMADMVKGWSDNWASLHGSKAELDSYVGTIKELAGQSGLTAEKQNALKNAVDGYNRITGDSISITDEANGKLADTEGNAIQSADAIEKMADAWYASARAQAYAKQIGDLFEKQVEIQEQMVAAQREVDKLQKRYDESTNPSTGLITELGKAKEALDGLKGAYDDTSRSIDDTTKKMNLVDQKMIELIDRNSELAVRLRDAGLGSADLSKALTDMGVSAERAAAMSTDQLFGLAEQVKEMDALKIDPKTFRVSDDGTISDQLGRVWDLKAQTIDGKHYTVSDDGTISVAGTSIDGLNAMEVADKPFEVTDGGTAAQAGDKVAAVDARKIDDKEFSVRALDRATGIIDGIKNKLLSLAGVDIPVGRNASGGISPVRIERVPMHADGGIYTAATLTNVGVVGEAGAEAVLNGPGGSAIVPLTNRHYVRPFARAVAAEIPQAPPIDLSGVESRLDALTDQVREMDVLIDGERAGRILAPIINERLGAVKEEMQR
ncbi:hypothetical protein JI75_02610 [Berryella intestinalis]|uniref:Phage tail tape measure protein domain-containing protein n=1 Tax=Berryella intestinalis TaxID=1531429 RepID=A0A0A8B9B9_9ACTN|nr:phage tail tape measure protein [Berryella intestinalis]AJC11722.1 hypothetical protein JI75_02610 [Berryella intestinalis]